MSVIIPLYGVAGIDIPSDRIPLSVADGAFLKIPLSLPVSLTPPPGVQQPKAWRGWRVYLRRRVTMASNKARGDLIYQCPVVRVRPDQNNQRYVLSVRTGSFWPDGVYDLVVYVRGVRYFAAGAVKLGSPVWVPARISIRGTGDRFVVTNPGRPWDGTLELLVPHCRKMVQISVNGRVVVPELVTFGTSFFRGKKESRYFRFSVVVPGGTPFAPGRLRVRVQSVSGKPSTKARIVVTPPSDVEGLLGYARLKLVSDQPVGQVIWRFNDGGFAEGRVVRYRFLIKGTLGAEAWVLGPGGGIRHLAVIDRVWHSSGDRAVGCGFMAPVSTVVVSKLEMLLRLWF